VIPSLHPIRSSDLGVVFRGLSDPRVTHHYGVHFNSLEEARTQLDWFADLERTGAGRWWAIRDGEGEFLGAIGINGIVREHQRGELGFWLLPEHWGQGIMARVLPVVIDRAFRELGLHRMVAEVETENAASARVLQRAGFTREGVLHDHEWKNGRWVSLEVWALVQGA